tara:strand:+ start:391218 stop:391757 length:540 start_codon:yes stop_codon:yes gene_type:complete
MKFIKKHFGFTLIELLVVVSIIGVLSTIVMSSLNDARVKARDTRRLSDMRTIYQALFMYELDNGFLPLNASYTEGLDTGGGFDWSAHSSEFLYFLVEDGYLTTVPLDPVNADTGTSNSTYSDAGDLYYRYYCYPSGVNKGLSLSYRRESDGVVIHYAKTLNPNSTSSISDDDFDCGTHS